MKKIKIEDGRWMYSEDKQFFIWFIVPFMIVGIFFIYLQITCDCENMPEDIKHAHETMIEEDYENSNEEDYDDEKKSHSTTIMVPKSMYPSGLPAGGGMVFMP